MKKMKKSCLLAAALALAAVLALTGCGQQQNNNSNAHKGVPSRQTPFPQMLLHQAHPPRRSRNKPNLPQRNWLSVSVMTEKPLRCISMITAPQQPLPAM